LGGGQYLSLGRKKRKGIGVCDPHSSPGKKSGLTAVWVKGKRGARGFVSPWPEQVFFPKGEGEGLVGSTLKHVFVVTGNGRGERSHIYYTKGRV